MKNYKNFESVYLGESDIADLILRTSAGSLTSIHFGSDGDYYAYYVDIKQGEEVRIGEHYQKVFEGKDLYWAKIYDDTSCTLNMLGKFNLTIYRASSYGCIIVKENLQ